MYARTKCNAINAIFSDLAISEIKFIIYRPDLHNLQANRKKLKK